MREINLDRSKTGNSGNGIGIRSYKTGIILAAFLAFAAIATFAPAASASSGYFTGSGGCSACHVGQTGSSYCGMCHAHGVHASSSKTGINVTAATNKSTYAPGETVSVTISGGYRASQARAILYDQNGVQVAVSTGTPSSGGGPVNAPVWPRTLSAPAPATPGTYTWKAAWYGNQYDTGSATFGAAGTAWIPDPGNPNHGEERVSTNSFTVAAADTTPPTVSSTSPANNATGVAVGSAITATFSEAVAPASVTAASFTLSGGVTGTVSASGATATFAPSSPLANGTTYTATITTAVTDVAGNHLAANRTWTFTTTSAADTTPPLVNSMNPSDTQVGVAANAVVTVTFSEAVVVPPGSFALSGGAGSVPGTIAVNGTTVTFTPSAILSDNTTYTATLTTAITDIAGNPLAANYSSTFTTSAATPSPVPDFGSSDSGGCAIARSGRSVGEIDGAFGFLVLTGLGMGICRQIKRKSR